MPKLEPFLLSFDVYFVVLIRNIRRTGGYRRITATHNTKIELNNTDRAAGAREAAETRCCEGGEGDAEAEGDAEGEGDGMV